MNFKKLLFCSAFVVVPTLFAQNPSLKSVSAVPHLERTVMTQDVTSSETVLGYCPDEIGEQSTTIGAEGVEVVMAAAVRFPASKMSGLKGGKITKIRIAMLSGMSGTYVWIRNQVDGRPLLTQSVANPVDGWNEVTLNTPYTITGDEIYVGYTGRQPATQTCILTTGSGNVADAMYIAASNQWSDYSGEGWGALYIQAVAEAEQADYDLSVSDLSVDQDLYRVGGEVSLAAQVVNAGTEPLEGCEVAYRIGDRELGRERLSQTLAPGAAVPYEKRFALGELPEGVYSLKVYASPASADVTDGHAANDTASVTLRVYETSYPRKILFEHFTTIPCSNCPYADKVMEHVLASRSDLVCVAHHVGYREDELTIPESRDFLNLGVSGAPMGMADRTLTPGSYAGGLPFRISYTDPEEGQQYVNKELDYCAAVPALVSVTARCSFDEATRLLTVTAGGEAGAAFRSLYPDARISLFLTEDSVLAKQPQVNGGIGFVHNHVLRQMLTPTSGDALAFDADGRFTFEAETTLDEAWRAKFVRVVAAVHRPYLSGATPYSEAQVLNATDVAVVPGSWQPGTGIGEAVMSGEAPRFSVVQGRIVTDTPASELQVYSPDGARVPNSALAAGLYVVRLVTDGAVHTAKILVH